LLGNLNANPSQICAGGRIVPKLTKLIFIRSANRPIDPHHDPVPIGAAPHRGVWKSVVEGAQDRFCFLNF
jgi:hypothetical protein